MKKSKRAKSNEEGKDDAHHNPNVTTDRLVEEGKTLFDLGRYDKAASKALQALDLTPGHIPAQQLLKEAKEEGGLRLGAIVTYPRTLGKFWRS